MNNKNFEELLRIILGIIKRSRKNSQNLDWQSWILSNLLKINNTNLLIKSLISNKSYCQKIIDKFLRFSAWISRS